MKYNYAFFAVNPNETYEKQEGPVTGWDAEDKALYYSTLVQYKRAWKYGEKTRQKLGIPNDLPVVQFRKAIAQGWNGTQAGRAGRRMPVDPEREPKYMVYDFAYTNDYLGVEPSRQRAERANKARIELMRYGVIPKDAVLLDYAAQMRIAGAMVGTKTAQELSFAEKQEIVEAKQCFNYGGVLGIIITDKYHRVGSKANDLLGKSAVVIIDHDEIECIMTPMEYLSTIGYGIYADRQKTELDQDGNCFPDERFHSAPEVMKHQEVMDKFRAWELDVPTHDLSVSTDYKTSAWEVEQDIAYLHALEAFFIECPEAKELYALPEEDDDIESVGDEYVFNKKIDRDESLDRDFGLF